MFGKHSSPISKTISDAIENKTIDLDSEESLDSFIMKIQEIQKNEGKGRASSINLLNINNGRNTIEFRVANGSLNPETWIENARLFGRIVQMSEKIAQLEKKQELNEEEKRTLSLMSSLKEDIPEKDKLEVLLDLLFTEEEKTVYRDRYDKYNELSKNIPENEQQLKGMEFAQKVDFKHGKKEFESIAKGIRAGEIAEVTGETKQGVKEENKTLEEARDEH